MKIAIRLLILNWFLMLSCGEPTQQARQEVIQESRPTPSPKMWSVLTSSMKQLLIKQIYVTMDSTFIEVQSTGFEEREYNEIIRGVDPIIKAFNADLDEDGFDEIYLITQSNDENRYGGVLAFNSNKDKSLSMIHFPGVNQDEVSFEGYKGQDQFTIEENRLVRFFPIEKSESDRRITYFLYPGEASMQLAIEKVEDVTE